MFTVSGLEAEPDLIGIGLMGIDIFGQGIYGKISALRCLVILTEGPAPDAAKDEESYDTEKGFGIIVLIVAVSCNQKIRLHIKSGLFLCFLYGIT